MVEAAGGDNVFADVKREAVQATTELILARAPEVILEIRAGRPSSAPDAERRSPWNALASVPAVRTDRVYILVDPRTVVPGPRVAEAIELIARALHPGVQVSFAVASGWSRRATRRSSLRLRLPA